MSSPYDLAVDLHDLWFAANACQDMSSAHTSAKGTVAGVAPSGALSRPADIGLGATGFYDAFASLQEQVETMLSTNGTNLADTATAMQQCITIYVNQDAAVKREFDQRKKEIPYE